MGERRFFPYFFLQRLEAWGTRRRSELKLYSKLLAIRLLILETFAMEG